MSAVHQTAAKTIDSSAGDFYASGYGPILSLFDPMPSRLYRLHLH
jgi:hypothetical protein